MYICDSAISRISIRNLMVMRKPVEVRYDGNAIFVNSIFPTCTKDVNTRLTFALVYRMSESIVGTCDQRMANKTRDYVNFISFYFDVRDKRL